MFKMKIIYLTAFFFMILSLFGILFLGIVYHEILHLDLRDNPLSEEAVCVDLSGKFFAYSVLNKTEMESYDGYVEDDNRLSEHFDIYFSGGILIGFASAIILIEFGALCIWLYNKNKEDFNDFST